MSAFRVEGLQDSALGLKEQDSVLHLQPNMLRCTQEVSGLKIDMTAFVVRDLLLNLKSLYKISRP